MNQHIIDKFGLREVPFHHGESFIYDVRFYRDDKCRLWAMCDFATGKPAEEITIIYFTMTGVRASIKFSEELLLDLEKEFFEEILS